MEWSELFELDPDAGMLTWKTRPRHHFANDRGCNVFNSMYAGSRAGKLCRDGDGYTCVELVITMHGRRRSYKAHRVIWEMVNGPIPDGMEIDHVDNNPTNNSIGNLRLATRFDNARNVGLRRDNTTGYKGVHVGPSGRYIARIQHNKKRHSIGVFDTPEMAHEAYVEAANRYHKEFAKHGGI